MMFVTLDQDAGQVVEVAYAETADGVVKRWHDRSDNSVSYEFTEWTDALVEWSSSGGPDRGEPPRRECEWVECEIDDDEDDVVIRKAGDY